MSTEVYKVTCPQCGRGVTLAFDVVEHLFIAICEDCRYMSLLDCIREMVNDQGKNVLGDKKRLH